jgi:hypothetical protein
VETDLLAINQKLDRMRAELALLKAQRERDSVFNSPWIPLTEAASRLNFSSPRVLKNRIRSGKFPPDCYREDPTTFGHPVRYLIHVERYIKRLN